MIDQCSGTYSHGHTGAPALDAGITTSMLSTFAAIDDGTRRADNERSRPDGSRIRGAVPADGTRATPDAIVATLQREIGAALNAPDVRETLRTLDMTVLAESGAAAETRLSRARDRYAETIRKAGIKFE